MRLIVVTLIDETPGNHAIWRRLATVKAAAKRCGFVVIGDRTIEGVLTADSLPPESRQTHRNPAPCSA